MQQYEYKCYKSGAGSLQCSNCHGNCKKNGSTFNNKQRYKCKSCGGTFITAYDNKACITPDAIIIKLLKEGCGIRSMSRLLGIGCGTVLNRIISIAKNIPKPIVSMNKSYEVDELRTYYKNKGRLLWIVYALQRDTKTVVDFAVGSRTKATLQKVTGTLLLSGAQNIYTDKLNLYGFLLPAQLHCTKRYCTNTIERKNLSLRTHLKRLNRKTICYNKSISMLKACLKIYFWK